MSGMVDARVDEVRRFNRFFTRRIGVLREGLLRSPFSLTEARVLFEVSRGDGPTASDLARDLGLDPGYLSRILAGLGRQGLVEKVSSEEDGRRRLLRLTAAGEDAFSALDRRSREEVAGMLDGLSEDDQRRFLRAARTIEGILGDGASGPSGYSLVLRPPGPGDVGWIVQRHGELYAKEYGWDTTFEALVARIVADFVEGYDPAKERCWIAELAGERVGCVAVVEESNTVARLRLLLVDPSARGLGLGSRLVDECIGFARDRGYRKLTLWTNSVLAAARRIYEDKGFVLVEEQDHRNFGRDLVGESWELEL